MKNLTCANCKHSNDYSQDSPCESCHDFSNHKKSLDYLWITLIVLIINLIGILLFILICTP